MFDINGKFTNARIMIDDVEEACVAQITKMVNHPAFVNPVAIMPDTHAGKGSVIGFTMPMGEKVIPNVVGVDIGCGMLSLNVGKELPIDLEHLDHKIRQRVPFGFEVHEKAAFHMKEDFPWRTANTMAEKFATEYRKKFGEDIHQYRPSFDIDWFMKKCGDIGADLRRTINSMGTLGGGNHFIEVGTDGEGNYWITIHTGSRNFGKCVCDYWQNIASKVIKHKKKDLMNEAMLEIRQKYTGMEIKRQIRLKREELGLNDKVSVELQYLEGEHAAGYLFDMVFAQQYAKSNRQCIATTILDILGIIGNSLYPDAIETVHNFIDFRDFTVRKGAIRAYTGERMIIPFNMRDGILFCEGKSNPEWNYSAPHGAGRLMSRAQAKKNIDLKTFESQMEGIYSTSVESGTLDEAPDAYKDAKVIEKAIEPTAKILFKVKPIMNMKDTGSPGWRKKK